MPPRTLVAYTETSLKALSVRLKFACHLHVHALFLNTCPHLLLPSPYPRHAANHYLLSTLSIHTARSTHPSYTHEVMHIHLHLLSFAHKSPLIHPSVGACEKKLSSSFTHIFVFSPFFFTSSVSFFLIDLVLKLVNTSSMLTTLEVLDPFPHSPRAFYAHHLPWLFMDLGCGRL